MEKCMTHKIQLPWQRQIVLLLLPMLLLSACTLLPSPTRSRVAPPPPTEEQEVRALLGEVPQFVLLTGEEAKLEQQSATLTLARGATEMARLRLALLLSLGVGGRSESRLQALLDDPESHSPVHDSPRQQLWTLLQRMSSERLRTQHDAQLHAEVRIRDYDARLREAQARADDLQQKLDALKSVERTLNKRSRRPGKEQP
jgi:hypothetical protein